MKDPKDKPEIRAVLELLPDEDPKDALEVLDHHPEPKAELTPEQIQALEIEKQQLLGELRGHASMEPRPVSVAPVVDLPLPEIEPTPDLIAANAAIEAADAELEQMDAERKSFEKARAESVAFDDAVHRARVVALNEKRNAAAAEAKRLREIAAGVELQARAEQARALAAREHARERDSDAQKTAALVERMRPAVDRARAVEVELKQIAKQHEPTLATLANQTWRDIPAEWVGSLWAEYSYKVIGVADKRLRELRHMLDGLKQNIALAEKLMAHGWSDDQSQRQDVNEVLRDLGYSVEYTRGVREGLVELNERLASIHERGEAIAPQAQRPDVKILITGAEREQVMFDMQMNAQMRGRQSRANT